MDAGSRLRTDAACTARPCGEEPRLEIMLPLNRYAKTKNTSGKSVAFAWLGSDLLRLPVPMPGTLLDPWRSVITSVVQRSGISWRVWVEARTAECAPP